MALALVEGRAKSSTVTLALFWRGRQNWAVRLASNHWARLISVLVKVRSRVFMLSEASMSSTAISGVRCAGDVARILRPEEGEDEQCHQ